jgi:hypothetical protein
MRIVGGLRRKAQDPFASHTWQCVDVTRPDSTTYFRTHALDQNCSSLR